LFLIKKSDEYKSIELKRERILFSPFRGWGIKNGKLLISHRSTVYPCYLPILGEFNRSWPYKACRCKDKKKSLTS